MISLTQLPPPKPQVLSRTQRTPHAQRQQSPIHPNLPTFNSQTSRPTVSQAWSSGCVDLDLISIKYSLLWPHLQSPRDHGPSSQIYGLARPNIENNSIASGSGIGSATLGLGTLAPLHEESTPDRSVCSGMDDSMQSHSTDPNLSLESVSSNVRKVVIWHCSGS